MITCDSFLEGFSDYLDREVSAEVSAAFDLHLQACEDCRRYRDVMVKSLALVRALDPPAPTEVFKDRLNARLYLEQERGRATGPLGSGATSGTTLVVTLLFAAAAWSPTLATGEGPDSPADALAHAASPAAATGFTPFETATGMSSFAAGQITLYRAEELEEDLWSYPNSMFYAYSSLSRRRPLDSGERRVRAVGVQ